MHIEKVGAVRAEQMEATMKQVAANEGLDFKYGGMTGHSRNGHRLVYWAQSQGGEEAQNAVMLGLWRRYFEQEVDITTLETLIDVGLEAGLGTRQEIKTFLESGKCGEEVDRIADEARLKGLSGVPNYEINDQYEVSGAQDPVAFTRLFKRWKDLEAKGQVAESGDHKTGKESSCL
jgi:predicted DsbA family dithiol-disulfide isomerase